MAEIHARSDASPGSSRKSHLWLWFVGGFVCFLVGLCFWSWEYFDGQVVYRTRLWQYYRLEIERAGTATGNLGPTTGNTGTAVTVALQRLLFSVVGGVLALGVGWLVAKWARHAG